MNLSEPDRLTERHRKRLATLNRRRGRQAEQAYLIEGPRLLESTLQAGAPLVEVIATDAGMAMLPQLPEGVRLWKGRPHDLARISDMPTAPEVIGVGRIPEAPAISSEARRILALDGVQDPGNVGTLIRSAAWFGFDAVVAGAGTADFYAPKVVRATMGGLWDVQLARVDALDAELARRRDEGFGVWCADLSGESYRSWSMPDRLVLVLGSEAHGVSDGVRSRADGSVRIGRVGSGSGAESLNVTAAGAVLMARAAGNSGA